MRCAHSLLRHLFRRQPAVSLLILASAAQAVLPTSAQEAEADAQLETVIVSAIGAPREAGELISHVDALTADDLQRVLRGSLGDTLDVEPGVSSTSFGQGASRPVLRGLGAERVLVLTNGLGAIDASAASPDHQVAADGIDAERVEIVRGPAALAYGGQAIGGIVNVIDGLTYQRAEESGLSGRGFATVESVNEGIEGGARFRAVSPDWTLVASASARDFGDYEIPGAAESAVQLAREGETAEDSGTLANSFVKTSSQALGLSHTFENGFFGLALHGQQSEYGLPGGAHEDEEGAEAEAPFIDLEQTRIDLRGGLTFNGGWLTGVKASAAFADYQHTEFEAVGEPGTVFESDGSESRLEAAHEFGSVEGVAGVQYADVSLAAEGD
jgi:iron complex outermembrane receptor protein